MFSKKQRLNTSEFDEVFNFGKTIKKEFFIVKYKKNDLLHPRFAVAVSKKKFGNSVQRHLIKRRFFGALKKSNLINEKKDFVFVLSKGLEKLREQEITLIINKIRLE